MLNKINNGFYSLLFNNNEIIKQRDEIQKNISEQLLTIRTLIIKEPSENEADEHVQLSKILGACKLEQKDYALILEPQLWKNYRQYQNIREILLFGTDESSLGLTIKMDNNKIIRFDERVWIKTVSIAQLSHSKDLKNDLWQNALKPHFVQ